MRCKIHNTDLTSITGVCASCLRERLFKLIQSQTQNQAQAQTQAQAQSRLPRSNSPYNTTHQKSNSVTTVQRPYNKPHLNHSISEKRFFNSPQIAIVTGGCIGSSSSSSSSSNGKKPPLIRFPSISNIFRSNSRNCDRNGNGNGDAYSNHRVSVSSCNESTGVVRKQRCVSVSDRGMSPVRNSDDEDDSPYESAESCKRTPSCTVVRRGGGQKSVADLMFCPLVSANSNRLMNVKEKGKVVVVGGGEARVPMMGNLSYVKSFSGNRSRKIADFGRVDPNR